MRPFKIMRLIFENCLKLFLLYLWDWSHCLHETIFIVWLAKQNIAVMHWKAFSVLLESIYEACLMHVKLILSVFAEWNMVLCWSTSASKIGTYTRSGYVCQHSRFNSFSLHGKNLFCTFKIQYKPKLLSLKL